MCRKIIWCYVFVLTLLDLSLNTKLTAQGTSHGVTVQESLREGITFQEWDKEAWGESAADAGEALEGVVLEPPALRLGRAALAEPHARTVTVHNAANDTLHLASVAGSTPDFYASFFEAKTLAPAANTTFTVVYLGRREGPVSARLYIHTSLGVLKYRVSAVGVCSEYEVWPLVGVRVPLNASVEWELRVRNPTSQAVQVREVYSTAAWLALALPDGGASAGQRAWLVPPRGQAALVRVRIEPQHAPHAHHNGQRPLTAYVRIKADIPGGGLVVPVEARSVPAGEHARPLHVRLRPRGATDPAHTVEVEMANSGGSPVTLEGSVRGGCWASPTPALSEPCVADTRRANGASSSAGGARLALLRAHLEPHQQFTRVARLTLDYAELWAQTQAGVVNGAGGGGAGPGGEAGAWCAGCVRLGGAALPYSVRVLPGALTLHPPVVHVIMARGAAARETEVEALNEFQVPLRVDAVQLPAELLEHFQAEVRAPLTLAPGAREPLLRLRLRAANPPPALALAAAARVLTNLSDYQLPVKLYSGQFLFEWEWGNSSDGELALGTLGTSSTRRVGVRLRNPAPVPLCVLAADAALPGADAALALAEPLPVCVEGGGAARAWLTVVAPARGGPLRGEARVRSEHALATAALTLRARAGRLHAPLLLLPPAAPYTESWAELVVNNSMAVRMRVLDVAAAPDAAVSYEAAASWVEAGAGRQALGRVHYRAERACEPACYAGRPADDPEGVAWLRRGAAWDEAALLAELADLRARLATYRRAPVANVTLRLHTDEVYQTTVSGSVQPLWPRLVVGGSRDSFVDEPADDGADELSAAEAADLVPEPAAEPEGAGLEEAGPAGHAGLAGVRDAVRLRLRLRNPARVPLLLHAVLHDNASLALALPDTAGGGGGACGRDKCVWASDAFTLSGWRALAGAAREWAGGEGGASAGGRALPPLLLGARAELELSLVFAPQEAAALTTYLYLRNNLTVLEGVQLFGQGEYPTFELSGRRPGSSTPFLFEVKECSWGVEGGAVWRRVVARNRGRVPVRLARGALAGAGCAARGFRLAPCGALRLAPGAAAPLRLAFAPDYTLARAAARLRLPAPRPADFLLVAAVPPHVRARCAPLAPPPPWDAPLRTFVAPLAIVAFVIVMVVAAFDAERLLRVARQPRLAPVRRAPLDLRDLTPVAAPVPAPAPAPPPAPAPAPRRRRVPRRSLQPLDPDAERRAFERWRSEVLRQGEDSSRSSEDDAPDTEPVARTPSPPVDDPAEPLVESRTPTPSPEASVERPDRSPDLDVVTSGSDTSTPIEERDDADDSYGGDVEPDPRDDSPAADSEAAVAPPTRLARSPPRSGRAPPRSRRSPGEAARRAERTRAAAPLRPHARRERGRRRERAPGAVEAEAETAGAEEARGGVRWGASWSSVVAGAPLPPIGSDVRRRGRGPAPDNSLFYFNGAEPLDDLWRPPAPERPPFVTPARDYIDECHVLGGPSLTGPSLTGPSLGGPSLGGPSLGGPSLTGPSLGAPTMGGPPMGGQALGNMGAVWGGGWGGWGAGALRPPPGFAPPPPRPFDPFRSLASIWAPAPHDWRPAAPPAPLTPPHAPPPGPPAAPDDDHQ